MKAKIFQVDVLCDESVIIFVYRDKSHSLHPDKPFERKVSRINRGHRMQMLLLDKYKPQKKAA
jgi:hypothetical protein